MADQVTTDVRSMVERLLDPKIQDTVTKRGRALVAALGEAAEMASERAATGWRDAEPIRRDAARAGRDALRWGNRTWRQDLLPGLNNLWNKRTVALGAAGAAVPVAKELIDDAAVRMGIRARREPRHWGAFLGGLLLGAIGGLIAAILTAPKAGREMRDEVWNSPDVRRLGVRLNGDAINELNECGQRIAGDTLQAKSVVRQVYTSS